MESKTDCLVAVNGSTEWRTLEDDKELGLKYGVVANPVMYKESTMYRALTDKRLQEKIAALHEGGYDEREKQQR